MSTLQYSLASTYLVLAFYSGSGDLMGRVTKVVGCEPEVQTFQVSGYEGTEGFPTDARDLVQPLVESGEILREAAEVLALAWERHDAVFNTGPRSSDERSRLFHVRNIRAIRTSVERTCESRGWPHVESAVAAAIEAHYPPSAS